MLFQYPSSPHLRRHGPFGYEDYTSFKEWLRDEFTFRCVYCLERERWYPSGSGAFGVEHVKPKGTAVYKPFEHDYENLVYACNRCNSRKGEALLLNPGASAFGTHLHVDAEGNLVGLTPEGNDLIDILALNDSRPVAARKHYLRILRLYQRYPNEPDTTALYQEAFGYPDDLPDLALLRPAGNTQPAGVRDCCFHQREEGRLPDVYF